ncbi:MAG: T9SS type A sorting domain-containing protein [Bacteroidia bacterium]|nr:T9SS type A sorting domain-containing protein [Bacteroidia bacterium]
MKRSITLTTFLLLFGWAWAQPVSTYPYVQNFDAFPTSNQGSGVEPNPNTFPDAWTNDITGDGPQDWHAVRGATPTAGTGPDNDHTLGNSTGVYLYVEDSGRDNDSVILFTPFFNLSALPNPRLAFWVHSDANLAAAFYGADSSFNDLKLDYFNGAVWTTIDSIGVLGTGWTEVILSLTGLPPIVRFRFRINNNNYGDFVHDIGIDDFSVYDQPVVDGAVVDAGITLTAPAGYTLAPPSQGAVYSLSGRIQNRGLQTLTSLVFKGNFGTYADSVTLDSLVSFQDSALTLATSFTPTEGLVGTFSLKAAQTDTFPDNDQISVAVVDSVLARDDSTASGGLGFTGANGVFGLMFELTQPDVLTSTSFFLNSSTIGDTLRVLLYGFGNDLPGEPDTSSVLDSTIYWQIPARGWQTLGFTCQNELPAGKYFIACEQVNLNNLGFGYDIQGLVPGTAFFGDGVTRWTLLEAAVPSLASAFMIRMNFGPTQKRAAINAPSDRICIGDDIALTATGAAGTYTWTGVALDTTGGASVIAAPTADATYTVSLLDNNGCASIDSVQVGVNPLPTPSVSGDTVVCEGSAATLTASGGNVYEWSTGETTASISVTPSAPTTYTVTVSDSIGCASQDTISVALLASPTVALDSTLAFFGLSNGTATASGSGGTGPYTYSWNNGQDSSTAVGLAPGTYTVTVTDANGCSVVDSIAVTEAATGISDLLDENLIEVYPNPTSGTFTISNLDVFGQNASLVIKVVNVNGSEVARFGQKGRNEMNISLGSQLPDGVYMVEISNGEKRAVKRIMIAR